MTCPSTRPPPRTMQAAARRPRSAARRGLRPGDPDRLPRPPVRGGRRAGADAAMLAGARRAADEAGITYVVWVNAVAEALRTAAAGGRTTRTGAGCGWSDTSRTERRSTNMEPLAVLRRHTR